MLSALPPLARKPLPRRARLTSSLASLTHTTEGPVNDPPLGSQGSCSTRPSMAERRMQRRYQRSKYFDGWYFGRVSGPRTAVRSTDCCIIVSSWVHIWVTGRACNFLHSFLKVSPLMPYQKANSDQCL